MAWVVEVDLEVVRRCCMPEAGRAAEQRRQQMKGQSLIAPGFVWSIHWWAAGSELHSSTGAPERGVEQAAAARAGGG